jgi:rare lipoprotein A
MFRMITLMWIMGVMLCAMPVQAGTLSRDGHESTARGGVGENAKSVAHSTHRARVHSTRQASSHAWRTASKRYAHSAPSKRHVRSAKANHEAHAAEKRRYAAHRKAHHRVASTRKRPVQTAYRRSQERTAAIAGGYQTGVASYYWQPQRVASGGWFNPRAMTAAHKTLPFGTKVRVTHLGSGRSVDVTINDRGPYIGGRIIDLSTAAAEQLGMRSAGLAKVKLEVLGR